MKRRRASPWLYTIAHNLLVDHWRRKGLTLVELDSAPEAQAADNPARQAEARERCTAFSMRSTPFRPRSEAFLRTKKPACRSRRSPR